MNQVRPYKDLAERYLFEMTTKYTPVEVKVDPATCYAAALPKTKTLYMHPLTAIGPSDLPTNLRVTGPDDPKLRSPHYFHHLKSFLANKFDIDPTKLTNLRSIFDMHLRTWQNPKLISRIKRFAIAHEVGHIFHGHQTRSWDKFFGYILSVIISVALLEFLPFFTAILCTIAVADVCYRGFKALREYSEQYQEKEADLKALEVTSDFIGAKAFFKALDRSYQKNWNQLNLWQRCQRAILHPESLFHISHPSPETRINYLRRA
ncbi:MAG: M48 family metalloprotease [Simkaniaceae bacterium]|nr:M48 family metalloprotease [Candidatus Sacchlamyda saccharinae]